MARTYRAARQQAVREDRRVTVSDWVREALTERLERETGARSRGRVRWPA